MVYEVISSALISIGAVLLAYGFYAARELRQTLGTGELKEAWDYLSVLILFFIAAYIAFLGFMFNVLLPSVEISPTASLMLAIVFSLGGGFVAATAHFNYKAFR